METDNNENKFIVGENILCYSQLIIYKAKLIKSCYTLNDKLLYYVHYTGWKNTYDEWVDEDRVLKVNAENIAKMNETHRLFSYVKKKKIKRNNKKSNAKRGRKSSKILSVGSIKTASVSSELLKISNKKNLGTNNLDKTNSVEHNRPNQLIKKGKPTYPTKECNNLKLTRKPDPRILDYIDLTQDKVEKNDKKMLMLNIYISGIGARLSSSFLQY